MEPIPPAGQTQRPVDLFLIFVAANIVATTLQAGASLPATLTPGAAAVVIGAGAIGGAALTAVLAPIGSRYRVPSIVAARAALGWSGARLLAALLFLTNFAWIALNNVIAAAIAARIAGGPAEAWAVGLGVVAAAIVLGGPRLAAIVDRVAVPLLMLSGLVFTAACLAAPRPVWPTAAAPAGDVVRALDIVVGYQASWLLMFADYPRFVRSGRAAGVAVFLGLALTALWFMPLGLVAAAIAGSADPGAMVEALGLGWWGATLVVVAAVTTNFVNIYMSALAFRSLRPAAGGTSAVVVVGGIGALLGLLSAGWIERFAAFTLVVGGALVPIGGILLAHYFVIGRPVQVPDLYRPEGPYGARRGWSLAGLVAWLAGTAAFHLSSGIGGALPGLLVSLLVYVVVDWLDGRHRHALA